MPADYLHSHPQFADLIRIVAREKLIAPALVEKDYWIMHCLYGLQQLGMKFELKGGTSLSKGFQIINRFSEDIDNLTVVASSNPRQPIILSRASIERPYRYRATASMISFGRRLIASR